jgi:predicted metal-dependent hydrolase
MSTQLRLGDIDVEVVQKDIKNVHLSVHPPDGRVRVSAPNRMTPDTIRAFLSAKLPWIRAEQRKFQDQVRFEPPLYIDRESHYIWGERVLLHVVEVDAPATVDLSHINLTLRVRPGTDAKARAEQLSLWFRDRVREAAAELLPTWQARIGVEVEKLFVQHMKTLWGSCNPTRRTIRVNTELAKKPRACLEYILVHELVHIHEPTHNARFRALMDQYLPTWRQTRDELNRAPLAHEEWGY